VVARGSGLHGPGLPEVREKLVIWTLLDAGKQIADLASLTPTQID
jgi:hypothetical protein